LALINGYPAGEIIIRGEDPLLLQLTSAPFYYGPVSNETGGFDLSGRYFYYLRRKDITLPASAYRYDTRTLASELMEDMPDAARMHGVVMENYGNKPPHLIYSDGAGNKIADTGDQAFMVTVGGETRRVVHLNADGPSPDTRAYACLSPDCSQMAYFSNRYGLRHVFIIKFDERI